MPLKFLSAETSDGNAVQRTSILGGPEDCWSRRLHIVRLAGRAGNPLPVVVRMSLFVVVLRSPGARRTVVLVVDNLADHTPGPVAGIDHSSGRTGCMDQTCF